MGYAYYVVRTRDGFYTKSSLSERTLDPDKATRMKFNKAMQIMRDIGAEPQDVVIAPHRRKIESLGNESNITQPCTRCR